MMKLLVTDELSKEGIEMLTKDGGVQVDVKPKIPQEDLIKIIGGLDRITLAINTEAARVVPAWKGVSGVEKVDAVD